MSIVVSTEVTAPHRVLYTTFNTPEIPFKLILSFGLCMNQGRIQICKLRLLH